MDKAMVSKRSKRSSKVALTTIAALGSGAMLSACGGEPAAPAANATDVKSDLAEVQVFENVFACAKVTGKTVDQCQTMRDEAIAKAKTEAPRFEAIQDCESQYGQGQCVSNGVDEEFSRSERRHFSPFVVAWFSNSNKSNGPLFRSKAGGYQSANGARLSYAGAPGKYTTSNRAFERAKSVPKIKPASRLAKKGGFGGRTTGWAVADRNGAKSGKTSGGSTAGGSKGG